MKRTICVVVAAFILAAFAGSAAYSKPTGPLPVIPPPGGGGGGGGIKCEECDPFCDRMYELCLIDIQQECGVLIAGLNPAQCQQLVNRCVSDRYHCVYECKQNCPQTTLLYCPVPQKDGRS